MSDLTLDSAPSNESQIDRQMELIVSKIIDGTVTKKELVQYQELAAMRAKMMSPSVGKPQMKFGWAERKRA
jgi:hypothetical protein